MLSRPPTHPPVDLAQAAAYTPEDTTIDCGQTTVAEVARAIGRLKAGKAPGICGIAAELLKAGGHHTTQWLTKSSRLSGNPGSCHQIGRKELSSRYTKERAAEGNARITEASP